LAGVGLVFRTELRRRWRSWMAVAILISVVGGLGLASAAAAHRTESAFPRFAAAYGFDAAVYSARPVPAMAKLPDVVSVTEDISPRGGQVTCDCPHPINSNDLVVGVLSSGARGVWKLVSGHLPNPSEPDEVLASFSLQHDDGVQVGTVIRVPFYASSQFSAINNVAGVPPRPAVRRSPSAWSGSRRRSMSFLPDRRRHTTCMRPRRFAAPLLHMRLTPMSTLSACAMVVPSCRALSLVCTPLARLA
jgi:hypothetical protein